MTSILRQLPAVHQLKNHDMFLDLVNSQQFSEELLTNWLAEQVDLVRNRVLNGQTTELEIPNDREGLTEYIFDLLDEKMNRFQNNQLQRVVNATGVVLHTNLGRARLSEKAIEQIIEVASSYSTLEYNLETGERGSRHDIVEDYLKQITGAEAAIVVNNNAAAVYLTLRALAYGKEVIVSRGELVEIGGSFRISEIMEESEATLVDVGTTNKTHIKDYERALSENTALLMKVHKSNFYLSGFTKEVAAEDLVGLARLYNLPVYEDLGSGTLYDFSSKGIGSETIVQQKVREGVDLISFSGDKLLGGPQAGIIVGRKNLIDQLKEHQLARVLRVDKFTLAALEATLKTYIRDQAEEEIPTIRDITADPAQILKRAESFVTKIKDSEVECTLEREKSRVGGGTMPDVELDTFVVQVKHPLYHSAELAERLRGFTTPVIVRVKNDAVILDFRTVTDKELDIVVDAFLYMK